MATSLSDLKQKKESGFVSNPEALKTLSPAELNKILPPKEDTNTPKEFLEQEFDDGEVEIPDYILNPNMDMPEQNIDGDDYIGVLKIPSLSLELPIISRWNDARLRTAPCRYVGSAYTDDMVIAGHNYDSHFGRLKTLDIDDEVSFVDMAGNEFVYRVVETEILQPTAIEEMQSGDWDLTLFTCTIGGRTRVTVRCERIY